MPRLTRMGFTVRFHLAGSQPEDYGDGDGFEFREARCSRRSTLVPSLSSLRLDEGCTREGCRQS